jgi:[acyl-carrier-protein] S-malonyltransferase
MEQALGRGDAAACRSTPRHAAPVEEPDEIPHLLVEQDRHGGWRRERAAMARGGHPFVEVGGPRCWPDGQAHRSGRQATSVVTMDDIEALVKEI